MPEYSKYRHFDLIFCENNAPIERYSIRVHQVEKTSAIYERTFIKHIPKELQEQVFYDKFEKDDKLDIYIDFA